jgi:DNA-binding CsgD family transcriptional regulator
VEDSVRARKPAQRGKRSTGVPTTIRTTLLDRLEPLGVDDRRVVEQAAVIGRAFSLDLLGATLGTPTDALLAALRRSRDLQLIDELGPTQFRFRHVLTREAIYDGFLSAEVRAKHRAIAEALEAASPADGRLEALAYHWTLAGDAAKASTANEAAGDSAARVYAHDDAVAYYERAAEQPGLAVLVRAALVHKIADRHLVIGANEEALAAFASAADLFREAAEIDREAMSRARAAMTAYTMTLTDTTAPLVQALAETDPAEALARSRLHLAIAWINSALRRPQQAREHLAQVDPRAMESTDIAVRYRNVASSVAVLTGEVDGLRREHAGWLVAARARSMGAVVGAHHNGARYFSALGCHDEARAQIEAALHIAREMHSRHAEECAQATAALCYVASGDLQDARAALDAVPTSTDNRVNLTFAAAAGTLVAAYTGDETLAKTWFDGCEAAIVAAPELETGAGFAELLVRRGRTREAEQLLQRALPECEAIRGEVFTLLAIARDGAAAERRRAREYLARAAQENESDLVEAPALLLFDAYELRREGPADDVQSPARAPDVETPRRATEVESLARKAADGFRRLAYPLLEAEALELAGDVPAAVAVYERCGAMYHVRRLSGDRRQIEPEVPPASALSAREHEIVVLAGNGLSNIEIAQQLGITYKTVEKHLSAAYRKLDLRSRRELRGYARDAAVKASGTASPGEIEGAS